MRRPKGGSRIGGRSLGWNETAFNTHRSAFGPVRLKFAPRYWKLTECSPFLIAPNTPISTPITSLAFPQLHRSRSRWRRDRVPDRAARRLSQAARLSVRRGGIRPPAAGEVECERDHWTSVRRGARAELPRATFRSRRPEGTARIRAG